MTLPPATARYRAVSMELAAYLDARNVEMHILTDTGETITVVCPRDSIFAVQRHIEQMGRACPEIVTWSDQYRAALTRLEVSPPQRDQLRGAWPPSP
jgi:hypothetical protein